MTFGPGLEDEPALSPDGKFLAYTTDERGNLDIVVVPLSGGDPIFVTDHEADDAQPAWSPDGSRLAFVSARDRDRKLFAHLNFGPLTPYLTGRGGDIFVVPALGGTPAKLVENGSYPSWSPDGSEIAFQSDRGGDSNIWITSSEGGKPWRLTNDRSFQPSWPPDGEWIVYASNRPLGIHVVPADGGEPKTTLLEDNWAAKARLVSRW